MTPSMMLWLKIYLIKKMKTAMGLYLQGNLRTSMMNCRKGWHNFFDTNGSDLDCLVLLSS